MKLRIGRLGIAVWGYRTEAVHVEAELWTKRVGVLLPPLSYTWKRKEMCETPLLREKQALLPDTYPGLIVHCVEDVEVGEYVHIELMPLLLTQRTAIL